MPMPNQGLNKLMEECGELVQIAAKKATYPDGSHHVDGNPRSTNERLEDEMADVLAAMWFVEGRLGLDSRRIVMRATEKHRLFCKWNSES